MKKFLLFAILAFIGTLWNLNAQIELRDNAQENKTVFKNPTENNDFNTNAVPFNEKTQDAPKMNLNKFGTEQNRNISVKQANYNHYNQHANQNQKSIISDVDRTTVNRPQSTTLNNNQFNYNQNSNRKVSATNNSSATYNAPMQVKPLNKNNESTSDDNVIVETGNNQGISINPNDGSATNPIAPGGNPDPTPISDAIPFILLLASIYAFIIRRK